jgi:MoxR-like ATPase
MDYWHMQLHDNDVKNCTVNDIKEILSRNLIGCSGEPVGLFYQIKIDDIILVRHGVEVLAIVKSVSNARKTLPNELDEYIWFTDCIEVAVLKYYSNESVGGEGWFIPTTLQPIKNHIAYGYINDLFSKYCKEKQMEDKIKLLNYKHQIILQGPPGTGKTRMAKEIAKKITEPQNLGSPLQKINDFFSTYNSANTENSTKRTLSENLISNFQQKFPKQDLINLTLENYSIGTGSNDSFCWWIERGLKPLGYYFPGSARSYLIYWSKSKNEYSTHFNHSTVLKETDSTEIAMNRLAKMISELVLNKDVEGVSNTLGNSLVIKILNSYYPEEYFPINSVECLKNVLKLIKIDYSKCSTLEMNLKLQNFFNEKKSEHKSDIKNYEFMRFLFDNFDLKGSIEIQEEEVLSKGEYKLIQFHPAYSYEDFVRGIVAETNSNNQVEYKVVNKVLADFAEKALDNPSAKYVLIIDEINRANLPAVLGELIYALEYRYDENNPNETTVESMYLLKQNSEDEEGDKVLKLPTNLFIIGTMNTADRSVGHIDYAIRRRFAFVDVLPNISVIDDIIKDTDLNKKAKELFEEVAKFFQEETDDNNKIIYLQSDFKAKDMQLGHSYFLADNKEQLQLKLEFEIKPLLREYVKDGILNEAALTEIEKLC